MPAARAHMFSGMDARPKSRRTATIVVQAVCRKNNVLYISFSRFWCSLPFFRVVLFPSFAGVISVLKSPKVTKTLASVGYKALLRDIAACAKPRGLLWPVYLVVRLLEPSRTQLLGPWKYRVCTDEEQYLDITPM